MGEEKYTFKVQWRTNGFFACVIEKATNKVIVEEKLPTEESALQRMSQLAREYKS